MRSTWHRARQRGWRQFNWVQFPMGAAPLERRVLSNGMTMEQFRVVTVTACSPERTGVSRLDHAEIRAKASAFRAARSETWSDFKGLGALLEFRSNGAAPVPDLLTKTKQDRSVSASGLKVGAQFRQISGC